MRLQRTGEMKQPIQLDARSKIHDSLRRYVTEMGGFKWLPERVV
jgi:hypothetical protein